MRTSLYLPFPCIASSLAVPHCIFDVPSVCGVRGPRDFHRPWCVWRSTWPWLSQRRRPPGLQAQRSDLDDLSFRLRFPRTSHGRFGTSEIASGEQRPKQSFGRLCSANFRVILPATGTRRRWTCCSKLPADALKLAIPPGLAQLQQFSLESTSVVRFRPMWNGTMSTGAAFWTT